MAINTATACMEHHFCLPVPTMLLHSLSVGAARALDIFRARPLLAGHLTEADARVQKAPS